MADIQEQFVDFVKEELVEVHAMLNLIYDDQTLLLIASLKLPKEEHESVSAQALEQYRKIHRERLTSRREQSKK